VAGTQEERLHWVKSSKSGADGCVEIAYRGPNVVLVRDSKDPDGAVLTFNQREWQAFIMGIEAGEFDSQDRAAEVRPVPVLRLPDRPSDTD
jgi:hypothetical protein